MDIRGKRVLLLGGAGEVGMAIARALLKEEPAHIVIASLRKEEAEEAVRILEREKGDRAITFSTEYGNIFVRAEFKDMSWREIQEHPEYQEALMNDILNEMTREILVNSALYQMIARAQPDLVIDTINTATALAYQDVYTTAKEARDALQGHRGEAMEATIRKLLSTLYIPQLVRHIQILYESLVEFGVALYLKVGTTGTGGMGLNIPYTHGEERPSRVLLSKSAIAGAHSLLLFLADRTPGGPIVKEVKPAALIAWKGIGAGPIRKRGRPIPLHDCPPDQGFRLEPGQTFQLSKISWGIQHDRPLEAVYVDTGENGVFSLEEFKAITTLGQMEAVTPEEIAQVVVDEIRGDSTSFDVVSALDASVMGPTYRAGYLRDLVVRRMERLKAEKKLDSVAFEILGPPRLSKLLFEAELLRRTYGTFRRALAVSPEQMAQDVEATLAREHTLRQQMISVGIPILLRDGQTLLFARRPDPLQDKHWEREPWTVTPETLEHWTRTEWVDLRPTNMAHWQDRFRQILETLHQVQEDSGSRWDRPPDAWPTDPHGEFLIDPGECVGFIFIYEDQGARKKR